MFVCTCGAKLKAPDVEDHIRTVHLIEGDSYTGAVARRWVSDAEAERREEP